MPSYSFEIKREFTATDRQLYEALLDPRVLKSLWGLQKISITDDDGRQAYAEMTIDDENWNFTLAYEDLVQHELLSWKVTFDRFPGKEVSVSVSLTPLREGTELRLVQANFDSQQECDSNQSAWEKSLETLEGLFA